MSLLSLRSRYPLKVMCQCHYLAHQQILAPTDASVCFQRQLQFRYSYLCISKKRLVYVSIMNPTTYISLVLFLQHLLFVQQLSRAVLFKHCLEDTFWCHCCGSVIWTRGFQVPVAGMREVCNAHICSSAYCSQSRLQNVGSQAVVRVGLCAGPFRGM